jgi:hypothetical protein
MNDSLKNLCDKGLISKSLAMRRSPRPKEFARMLGLEPGTILPETTE